MGPRVHQPEPAVIGIPQPNTVLQGTEVPHHCAISKNSAGPSSRELDGRKSPSAGAVDLRYVAYAMRLLLLLTFYLGVAAPASAQRLHAIGLRWDNDILALRGTGPPPDYDYTQGLRLTADFVGAGEAASAPTDGQGSGRSRAASVSVSIGQRIYTPRQDSVSPVAGERPYAGWLYAAGEVRADGAHADHAVSLEVGITGPAALGEQVQGGVHRLIRSTPQQGWDHQLRPELAATARYRISSPLDFSSVQVHPHAEIGLGTLWAGAAAGVALRLGAPPGAQGWSARGGLRQEWVARNLFIDGNTFEGSVRADRRGFVTGVELGIGHRFTQWGVEYQFVVRSREYDAQPRPHGYGSLAAVWNR